MYRYEIIVKFDDSVDKRKIYLSFLNKYNTAGIGNEKKGTSSMSFFSPKKIFIGDLYKDLGGLEIITFSETIV